jgi:hypothetical protein
MDFGVIMLFIFFGLLIAHSYYHYEIVPKKRENNDPSI